MSGYRCVNQDLSHRRAAIPGVASGKFFVFGVREKDQFLDSPSVRCFSGADTGSNHAGTAFATDSKFYISDLLIGVSSHQQSDRLPWKVNHEPNFRSLLHDGITPSLRSLAVVVPEIGVTRQGGVRVIWIIGDRPIDSTFRFQRAHTA